MSAVVAGAFEGVVGRFFEAAAVPDLWPDVLHDLACACGAEAAIAMPVCGIEPLGPVASRAGAEFFHDFLKSAVPAIWEGMSFIPAADGMEIAI